MKRVLVLLCLIPSIAVAEDCPRGMESYCDYQEAKEEARQEAMKEAREQEESQWRYDMLEIERERNRILREEARRNSLGKILD